MKSSKFTDEQVAFAIKQVETGSAVTEVCRKMGISEATLYNGKKKFAGVGLTRCVGSSSSKTRTGAARAWSPI